ncbi:unnamed protein product [Onchocerca ochengi]|uniref:ULP_PROTEASE domain-containing protein n=1 Tax=Onchocerca ochengi TaxID=42157 RepID=A0A182E4X7_ONCOC|nr:unnamed protein product [Onchocerca ochengi]
MINTPVAFQQMIHNQKNRELLKIRRENSAGSSKLPNHSNELPLQEIKTGNSSQLPIQLSTFIRNAADMLKLFERIGTQGRNAQYSEVPVQQIIRRKSPVRELSVLHEFRSGRKSLSMKPLIEFNHDDTPTIASKANLQRKTIAEDTAWAELLFGPRGVLTAVFHILDDRRKITEKIKGRTTIVKNVNDRSQTTDTHHQSDLSLLPDFLVDAKPIDFAKIFEAFLTGSKGNFDERISNLPEILGICNRLSCGDIYKAIDEFRKSEFFANFQMILQLIQDPKGWEILGDFISNPDLIAQFMNGAENKGNRGSIGNLLGGIIGPEKLSKNSNKEIGSEDGDIGIDFSKLVENQGSQFTKPKKPTAEEFPEIAENIDSIDYYNAVEMGTDIDGIETIVKPDEIAITETTPISSIQTEVLPVIPDLMLPEISENIDQIEQTKIIIDATIPTPAKISNRKSAATLRPLRPYSTATYQPVTAKTTLVRKQTITSSNRSTTRYPAWIVTTVTRSTPKTTTRNFREESDYYSMYYDDVSS